MKKIWVIIKREYLVRVKTKAFLISTLISPVLMLALILLPGLLAAKGGGQRKVVVLDQTADSSLFDAVKSNLERKPNREGKEGNGDFSGARFVLTRQPVPPTQNIDEDFIKNLYQHEQKGGNNAYLVVSPGILDSSIHRKYNTGIQIPRCENPAFYIR